MRDIQERGMMLKAKTPLLEGLPQYVFEPPIEAVVLAFGVNEDFQLVCFKMERVMCMSRH